MVEVRLRCPIVYVFEDSPRREERNTINDECKTALLEGSMQQGGRHNVVRGTLTELTCRRDVLQGLRLFRVFDDEMLGTLQMVETWLRVHVVSVAARPRARTS